ncbi:MAG: hypothetical protein IKV38_01045, partial [Clostridia bacterium]|nr:hypothetical protein [Clostridia bacterium]
MTILKILSSIFFSVGSLYYLWIMQLNGYFICRSIKDLLLSKPFVLAFALSILQSIIAYLFINFAIFITFLWSILLIPFVLEQKKVPLKFTPRIVRWFAFVFILTLLLNLILGGWYLPLFVLATVLLSWLILLPIESLIKLFYVLKAQKKLKQMGSTIILITGSFGKTSTKNVLNAFLSTEYDTLCSPHSFNTLVGLARFINQIDTTPQYIILEGGAKQKGDIEKICKFFTPTHAIITGVVGQHLKTFKTLQNIIETKGEVIKFLPKEGYCILNADDDNSKVYFLNNPNAISVGKSGVDFTIKDVKMSLNGT